MYIIKISFGKNKKFCGGKESKIQIIFSSIFLKFEIRDLLGTLSIYLLCIYQFRQDLFKESKAQLSLKYGFDA